MTRRTSSSAPQQSLSPRLWSRRQFVCAGAAGAAGLLTPGLLRAKPLIDTVPDRGTPHFFFIYYMLAHTKYNRDSVLAGGLAAWAVISYIVLSLVGLT